MKKVRGKALALVLSIALVVSSFSTIPAAAASRTINGSLTVGDTSVKLVNGGKDSGLLYEDFGTNELADTLTTERHQTADELKVTAISHASGDRLVKWYDKDTEKSISADTEIEDIALALRSSTASGTEVLNVLYKGTWTDDKTDTTYTVRGTKQVTVTVYDLYQAVLEGTDTIDQYTVSGTPETAAYDVVRAERDADGSALADLTTKLNVAVKTEDGPEYSKLIADNAPGADVAYTIKLSGSNFESLTADPDGKGVTATLKVKPSSGTYTVTAEPTYNQKQKKADDPTYTSNASKSITLKSTITKSVSVDKADFVNFGKYSGTTYLYTTTLDKDTYKDSGIAYKVQSGYTFNFDQVDANTAITVDGKANVSGIDAKTAGTVNVNSGTVGSIVSDASAVNVNEAKVESIDFDDTHSEEGRTVDIASSNSNVGDITDALKVTVNAGTVGNVTAAEVDVTAQEDDTKISVGNITSKAVNVDSAESNGITTGTIKASDEGTTISLSGSAVTVKGIDFDYWENASLSFSNFQGSVPAPVKADEDGTSLITNDPEDDVTVKGDITIGTLSIQDESKVAFDGKVNVTSIDGAGSLIVGLNKLYVTGDASGVILKLSDNFKVGDTAFTAVSDTVDEDDFNTYGFTVEKAAGDKTDAFKINSVNLVGLTFNPASAEIVYNDSQTFTATPYAPGSSLPEGYKIVYTLTSGDENIFNVVDNGDGTATVKVVGYDDTFASENKGTLTAELVDADGNIDENYTAGELSLTALKVPKTTYKSDTTGTVKLDLGGTYQFKITSLDGKIPTLKVANYGATVTLANTSGNDYYYKVTGALIGNYGVYVNADKTPVAVLNITSNIKIDTTTVTIASGKTYQFKVTAPAQPTFQVAGLGTIALAQKIGNDYFYKVTANNVKGGHGVYVNGVRLAIATFA